MDHTEKDLICMIHSIKGMGNRRIWKIRHEFGSFANFIKSDVSYIQSVLSLSDQTTHEMQQKIKEGPDNIIKKMKANDIQISCFDEDTYPLMLRSIHNPPYILYYRGDILTAAQFCIAVVGSRITSNYGKIVARKLSREMAESGTVVVSGMARGIDTEAHWGAIEGGGTTIAVLGSGLNVVYPPENLRLFREITSKGLVISEFPVDTQPEPAHFPMRNRVIAGLSRGVIVVEAGEKSGALITADFALEQGREVFAVPGAITSRTSTGTNNLIKQGAKLVTSMQDILEEFPEKHELLGSRDADMEFPAYIVENDFTFHFP
jgi:DNA processing protein